MNTNINDIFYRLKLNRFPKQNKETLQAWDAADDYLIKTMAENNEIKESDNVLIFNDSFGALSLSLLQNHTCNSITSVTDSINSENGLINNAIANKFEVSLINLINSLESHIKVYNHVLIKAPKSLDYLIYFLSNIEPHIHPNCTILIAGMVKHLPKNLWAVLEQQFGPTHTSLAAKKAKIITLTYEKNRSHLKYPSTFQYENFIICNHASVFSKNSIDIGTRFLLENLPVLNKTNDIVDLGCGNGIVGLYLANLYPKAHLTLTDESYMAVASAQLTLQKNLNQLKTIQFKVNNCLDGFDRESVDLIVCNPPFHQSHNVGIQTALNMFTQSFEILRKKGHLIVIANRHLPYFTHLKRIFGKVINLASNQKFIIYLVQKS